MWTIFQRWVTCSKHSNSFTLQTSITMPCCLFLFEWWGFLTKKSHQRHTKDVQNTLESDVSRSGSLNNQPHVWLSCALAKSFGRFDSLIFQIKSLENLTNKFSFKEKFMDSELNKKCLEISFKRWASITDLWPLTLSSQSLTRRGWNDFTDWLFSFLRLILMYFDNFYEEKIKTMINISKI